MGFKTSTPIIPDAGLDAAGVQALIIATLSRRATMTNFMAAAAVHASPPTKAESAADAAASVSNPGLRAWNSPYLTLEGPWLPGSAFSGGDNSFGGAAYPTRLDGVVQNTNQVVAASFRFDGDAFEVDMKCPSGTQLWVWVDGQPISQYAASTTAQDNTRRKIKYTFSGSAEREITIQWNAITGGVTFYGIWAHKAWTIQPTLDRSTERLIMLGDSFWEGAASGVINRQTNIASQTARLLGIPDYHNMGVGSTGFTQRRTGTNHGYFRERLQKDVIDRKATLLIISGSLNDTNAPVSGANAPDVEAGLCIDLVRAALPKCKIVLTSPLVARRDPVYYNANQGGQYSVVQLAAALGAVAAAKNVPYIDAIAEEWVTGTGRVGAATGEGNSDFVCGTDAIHPSQAGHSMFARRISNRIRDLVPFATR